MHPKLLLFGFEELPAILAVEAAAGPFGAEVIPVARMDYNKPLAALAGLDTVSSSILPYMGGTLGGRMNLLCGLDQQLSQLLPALAAAGAGPHCLKAVLTEHNRDWNALVLYQELCRERQAIEGAGK